MMAKSGVIVAVLLGVALCNLQSASSLQSQYVPISKRYPGLEIPGTNPLVTVELVYDATCPDCANFDKIFRNVIDSLAQLHPGKFTYRYALQSLPFRITSFKVAQAVRYVSDQKGAEQGVKVLRHFLDEWATWSQPSVLAVPISKIMDELARETSELTGLPQESIRKQVAHYSETDGKTRQWAKYAMGTLHASSTPTVFVNGARVDGAAEMTADQLVKLLSDLI